MSVSLFPCTALGMHNNVILCTSFRLVDGKLVYLLCMYVMYMYSFLSYYRQKLLLLLLLRHLILLMRTGRYYSYR